MLNLGSKFSKNRPSRLESHSTASGRRCKMRLKSHSQPQTNDMLKLCEPSDLLRLRRQSHSVPSIHSKKKVPGRSSTTLDWPKILARNPISQAQTSFDMMAPAAREKSDTIRLPTDESFRSDTPIAYGRGIPKKKWFSRQNETIEIFSPNTPAPNEKLAISSVENMSEIEIEIAQRLCKIQQDIMSEYNLVEDIRSPDDKLKTTNAKLSNGQTLLFTIIQLKLERYVYRVLASGADPNVANDTGTTAAMLATMLGLSKSAKIILQYNQTNLSAVDADGNSVLILAAQHEAIDIALDFCTALRSRCRKDLNLIQRKNSMRMSVPNSQDRNSKYRKKLKIIQIQNKEGQTARSIAVAGDDDELVKMIDKHRRQYLEQICSNYRSAAKTSKISYFFKSTFRRSRTLSPSASMNDKDDYIVNLSHASNTSTPTLETILSSGNSGVENPD